MFTFSIILKNVSNFLHDIQYWVISGTDFKQDITHFPHSLKNISKNREFDNFKLFTYQGTTSVPRNLA